MVNTYSEDITYTTVYDGVFLLHRRKEGPGVPVLITTQNSVRVVIRHFIYSNSLDDITRPRGLK